MEKKSYYSIRNAEGRYLKVRTGSNGARRAWVKNIKGATVGTLAQMESLKDSLRQSPYYDGITIEKAGEAQSAWMVKLCGKQEANNSINVKVVDTFSGRTLAMRVEEKRFNNADGWEWLSDYQRKRMETFFGKELAYHCKVFTPKDTEYDAYYA